MRKNTLSEQVSYVEKMSNFIKNLNVKQIEKIVDGYISNAVIASELNFDWLQIHGAHGYFLSLLMSPEINKRQDKYNCQDILFIRKIVEGIRDNSIQIKIDIRISLVEGLKNVEEEIIDKRGLISNLVKLRFDMISFSNGLYDYDKKMIYPDASDGFLPMYKHASFFLENYPNIMWNLSGNVNDILKIKNFRFMII